MFSNLFLKKTEKDGIEIFCFNRKIETDTKVIFKTFFLIFLFHILQISYEKISEYQTDN